MFLNSHNKSKISNQSNETNRLPTDVKAKSSFDRLRHNRGSADIANVLVKSAASNFKRDESPL